MTLNGWLAGVISVEDATRLDDENQAQWPSWREQEQSKGRTTRRDPVRWLR